MTDFVLGEIADSAARAAGWTADRDIAAPCGVIADCAHLGVAVLRMLDALVLTGQRARLDFSWEADPIEDGSEASDLQSALTRTLICVAQNLADNGDPIYVSSDGRWFEEAVHGAFGYYGRGPAGLEALLSGERARPVLLPGASSVSLHGECFTAADSETYVIHP